MIKEYYFAFCLVWMILNPHFYKVQRLSACDIPANISSTTASTSSINLSWNAVPSSTSYTVQYRADGIITWDVVYTQTNSVILTGLQPGMQYEVRVQSICSGDSSQFSTIKIFATWVPKPDHIVICIMENKDYDQIVNSPAAPYINSLINDSATALFSQSFAIEHPSFPNYLDLFSGSNQGITQDTCMATTFTTENIGRQLFDGGQSFTSYCEDLPSEGYTGCSSGLYLKRHNAAVYWQGTASNQIPAESNKPFTSFPSLSGYDTLPTLSFVIPNKINDMHNGTIEMGDTWLQNNLGSYIEWAKTNNSLFIFTFDEDNFTPINHILTFFTGAMIKGGSYDVPINHFSVLRTIEDMYQLPYAGNADTATTILGCWKGQDSIATGGVVFETETESDQNNSNRISVEIFPNPLTENASVSVTLNEDERITMMVYNSTGNQVYNFFPDNTLLSKGHHSFCLPIENAVLIPGIYFIRLQTANQIIQQKLIVQ